MQSRKANKEERAWLDLIEQLPCLVCDVYHHIDDTPAETHHINGRTKPQAHLKTIRLCANHHRLKDNHHPKKYVSRHGDGKALFQGRYTHEMRLLEIQEVKVAELLANIV